MINARRFWLIASVLYGLFWGLLAFLTYPGNMANKAFTGITFGVVAFIVILVIGGLCIGAGEGGINDT